MTQEHKTEKTSVCKYYFFEDNIGISYKSKMDYNGIRHSTKIYVQNCRKRQVSNLANSNVLSQLNKIKVRFRHLRDVFFKAIMVGSNNSTDSFTDVR